MKQLAIMIFGALFLVFTAQAENTPHDNSRGVKQSDQQAIIFYKKACDMGDGDGCKNYTILNKQGN